MIYNAQLRSIVINARSLEDFATHMRRAMRHVREQAGFPIESHMRDGAMTPACHAELAMLNAARVIGVEFCTSRPGELDLRTEQERFGGPARDVEEVRRALLLKEKAT